MADYKQTPFKRGHGILLPLFSLPGDFGIGTLGREAKKIVDFISLSGGGYLQVLPLGPTGFGDSPYQCFSAFAGNPYLINPEWLLKKGWLRQDELEAFLAENTGRIDYGWLYKTRKSALKKAYIGFLARAEVRDRADFLRFKAMADFWLSDYAYFMSLKSKEKNLGREGVKSKEKTDFADKYLKEEIEFIKFLEFVFYTQWQEFKVYANSKNIKIIGDIPLYVANDSADVWGNPGLFMLDEKFGPALVAGVPPDAFSKEGQLWGNPLYNWKCHKETDYSWWKKRIGWQAKLFDAIRIDHFIGICRYYQIDSGAASAISGKWQKGPGKELTDAFLKVAPDIKFIAEDLGEITDEVKELLSEIGFPGMKVMQFGFEGDESALNWNIEKNTVFYPGTHDNPTLAEFFDTAELTACRFVFDYLGVKSREDLITFTLREIFKSPADTVIIPLQDYLGLDGRGRINTPATKCGNWQWRLKGLPPLELANKIKKYAVIYKREN